VYGEIHAIALNNESSDDSMIPRALGSVVNDLAATLGESEHYRFIATRDCGENRSHAADINIATRSEMIYTSRGCYALRRSSEKLAIVAAQ